MRYLALAADYDGTLAHHGKVSSSTIDALKRLKDSGRKLVMVSGRELEDLFTTFEHAELFDRLVLENGALLYNPATREETILAEPPPPQLVEMLYARGVSRISAGRVIVATWEPHQKEVLEVIQDLGIERQVIFNKGAVMVLPSGTNKATGLAAGLLQLGLSPHNCVAIGDAENDHTFLAASECGVAVSNALNSLKERADLVTTADHGHGVEELIDRMIDDDLASLNQKLKRHGLLVGKTADGTERRLDPFGVNLLIAGSSASGKSTITTGLLERLENKGYQFLIVDPEGDYSTLNGASVLGDASRAPLVEEVLDFLKTPTHNVVVNLLGIPLDQRPSFFDSLLPRLQALRSSKGRPHWVLVDEAHHLLHAQWKPGEQNFTGQKMGLTLITVHPESVSQAALERVTAAIVLGERPDKTLHAFCQAAGKPLPLAPEGALSRGDALLWEVNRDEVVVVHTEPPKTERRRHSRKYAEGNLGPDRSFYFRGPAKKLKLKAQNLTLFLQIAEGIDEETWLFHLEQGDYAEWFREGIKDEDLAAATEKIAASKLSADESRGAVRAAVEARYTLPSDRATGHEEKEDQPAK
ncbi:Sugar phosphatase YbiV [Anatilimnocola aggregata]|uniref:Sugar phosphatase YbiV n=1 Tax=Anatilimnocola aggregata TaxID=2528021 RepID=A0A517YHT1_9BACT|nr:HAD-IIB family hydrolase [Anatilimnocola aggregata]QDU29776.1 Sugar phosphatase YbiV [Anatilimnocola aggregata]